MAKYVEGKDCSEYAEDWIAQNNRGTLITFHGVRNGKRGSVFRTPFFGRDEACFYHTVVQTDDLKVIDVTNSSKEVWGSIREYKEFLKKYNGDGTDFAVYYGYKPIGI
ncbi:hypothetical protein [Acetivibrio ethanolgignens]|uniref:Uncharacterized protein n=1 Tax=Acetivibrio ethanolgignens TaxID=290052 RepID=A0A0V8QCR1_9FIRM|nr:hypothetical protein [Acetivibrio ethanolgignens]KSV58266.1 hypothetical protein ASU35_13465 [Acetivibrio ethanolgignens]